MGLQLLLDVHFLLYDYDYGNGYGYGDDYDYGI